MLVRLCLMPCRRATAATAAKRKTHPKKDKMASYACEPYMILKHVAGELLSTQKTLLTQTDLSVNTQEEM